MTHHQQVPDDAMEKSESLTTKDSKMNHLVDSCDHISALPNHILYSILADFQMVELVELSVLSRSWRHLWISIPFLNFDRSHFLSTRGLEGKFEKFVNSVLSLRDMSDITILRIKSSEQVDGWTASWWVLIADTCNAQEIDLDILPYTLAHGRIYVPSLVFGKSFRVVKLNLNYRMLRIQISCDNLKTLHLVSIVFPGTNFVLEIFKRCPLIEDFRVERCILLFYEVLEISSSNLKNLIFVNNGQRILGHDGSFEGVLKVSAPNLLSFVYSGRLLDDYILENLSSLENASIDFPYFRGITDPFLCRIIKGFCHASFIRLTIPISQYHFPTVDGLGCSPAVFYKLKKLELLSCLSIGSMQAMIHLLKHFPILEALAIDTDWGRLHLNLQNFEIEDLYPQQPWFETIPCLRYHLRKVEINNSFGTKIELDFLKHFLANGNVLEEVAITWNSYMETRMNKIMETKIMQFQQVFWLSRASPNVVLSFPRCEQQEPF